ncbi:hypothetical protein KM043_014276 [Ampulex compressa]|nr:hypothetical protein KM043_014276 [Ampulex compressa]
MEGEGNKDIRPKRRKRGMEDLGVERKGEEARSRGMMRIPRGPPALYKGYNYRRTVGASCYLSLWTSGRGGFLGGFLWRAGSLSRRAFGESSCRGYVLFNKSVPLLVAPTAVFNEAFEVTHYSPKFGNTSCTRLIRKQR